MISKSSLGRCISGVTNLLVARIYTNDKLLNRELYCLKNGVSSRPRHLYVANHEPQHPLIWLNTESTLDQSTSDGRLLKDKETRWGQVFLLFCLCTLPTKFFQILLVLGTRTHIQWRIGLCIWLGLEVIVIFYLLLILDESYKCL